MVQFTVQWRLSPIMHAVGVFYVNFGNLDSKSVRYRTVLCTWYHVQDLGAQRCEGAGSGKYSALQSRVRISWTAFSRSSLVKQWHPTCRTATCLYDQFFRSKLWASFSLSFCLFLSFSCRPQCTMKVGVWRSYYFPKWLGLIACLRWSMSRKNPSRRKASTNVEEILCSFSPYVERPEKATID